MKTKIRFLFSLTTLIFTVIIALHSLPAAALSQSQKDALSSGIYYFDTSTPGCTIGVDITLSGNDNIEKAYNFFIQKGLSSVQVAGLVGNLIWESHMNPTSTNSNGGAYGIAQWLGGRLDGLKKYAKDHNQNSDSLVLQLDYVWHELSSTQKAAGDDLKKQTSIDKAALSVFNLYERAGDTTGPKRINLARAANKKYGGSNGAVVVASTEDECSGAAGPGQDTKYIDGFTVYSQYDPQWVRAPYGSSTVGTSGCGPSAMAMIITALTDRQITPNVTAKYASSRGLYIPGQGSSWSIAPILAAHWGLKSKAIGKNAAKITAALQLNGLVIASGQGPLPFTSGGHYIVIRGVTADGKWKIGDSGHNDTSSINWNPKQLLDSMNDGSVYAITK